MPPRVSDPFLCETDINVASSLHQNLYRPRCPLRTTIAQWRTPLSRRDQGEIRRLPFYLTAPLICLRCNYRRKNRGRRPRQRPSNPDRSSRFQNENSTCEPPPESSRSLTSEEFCQTAGAVNPPATRCFVTPVKGHQSVDVDSQIDVSSSEADSAPFRPLGAISNRYRPPFLSPLCSPRKPRNTRFSRPVRAMMDTFLDSRAGSDMEDESGDESIRDIEGRLGISKHMSTPDSPTPPSSRASSRDTNGTCSTPTRTPRYSPRRLRGLYLLHAQGYQECPSEPTTSPPAKRHRTLAIQREGFWTREAERLKSCAPKILLPSWHLGLAGQGGGEDTERLMTLAEVSLAEMEVDMRDLDSHSPERRRFEVSGYRSTANWS